jgi:hypothetical protein
MALRQKVQSPLSYNRQHLPVHAEALLLMLAGLLLES